MKRVTLVGISVTLVLGFGLWQQKHSGGAKAAPDDPVGVVVDRDATGLLVTVNAEAANVHFTYQEKGCDKEQPCYVINAGQGMAGISASAPACKVENGNDSTPTTISCLATGVGAVSFKLVKGGTWAAYEGGGGQHAGGPCAPAKVLVKTGEGSNSVDSWNGCHEIVYCDTGNSGFAGVEADSSDEISGKCNSTVRH
jgi:hypothetical protein